MNTLALIRRTLLGLAGTALGVAMLALVAQADTGAVDGRALSVRIHSAEETLRNFCRRDAAGTLWLALPSGHVFELITTTADPSIVNKGTGRFHPFRSDVVMDALREVRYPLGEVKAEVFILPYPRRGALESGAAPGLVLLSPGTRDIPIQHQHAEVVHEIGHVVHYALMPGADQWDTYRKLRGIESQQTYTQSAPHMDRPHEIFAEDFRALFGGTLANYSGTIENASLPYPTQVAGLREWMLSLAGAEPLAVRPLTAFPNPTRGALTFTRAAAAPSALDLFDAQGRRVATVEPVVTSDGLRWTWDGRDAAGRRVEPGTLFARTRDPQSRTVRVTLLP